MTTTVVIDQKMRGLQMKAVLCWQLGHLPQKYRNLHLNVWSAICMSNLLHNLQLYRISKFSNTKSQLTWSCVRDGPVSSCFEQLLKTFNHMTRNVTCLNFPELHVTMKEKHIISKFATGIHILHIWLQLLIKLYWTSGILANIFTGMTQDES